MYTKSEGGKRKFFYISDDQYFFGNATPEDMMNYYRIVYPEFDENRFDSLLKSFRTSEEPEDQHLFQGHEKAGFHPVRYLRRDRVPVLRQRTGLDPVMRPGGKSIFANDMEERKLTPIISSHNLRELEDICDHVGLLHKGGILLSRDLDEMKMNLHKGSVY